MSKLHVKGASTLSEHQVHAHGVQMAAMGDFAGKTLNKALDRKHRGHIERFGKCATTSEVIALWKECLKDGDIPGAYWAAMSHPSANDDALRTIFEDVHMLSHLVGAANRADIKRLRELEQLTEELSNQITKQQMRLRDAVVSRDALIADLTRRLAAAPTHSAAMSVCVDDQTATDAEADEQAHLVERLSKLGRRSDRLNARVEALTQELQLERERRVAAETAQRQFEREVLAVEETYSPITRDHRDGASISGKSVLYVGGRTHHIPRLRSATELMGASFIHHDGGEECNSRLISAMIARANIVIFPVDCVSHQAVNLVKKTCRQIGKDYIAVRSSGLGSYLAALRPPSSRSDVAGNRESVELQGTEM